MACYSPIMAYNVTHGLKGAKALLKFRDRLTNKPIPRNWANALNSSIYGLPCGKCIGCRLDYSRMWADRMILESLYHPFVYFVTLTYDDEHLPAKGVMCDDSGVVIGESPRNPLIKQDLQSFMKTYRERLRRIGKKEEKDYKVRFYGCGEYGSTTFRPHYHIILFQNYELKLDYWKRSKFGNLYINDLIESVWSDDQKNRIGITCVSPANYHTMAYVARYVTKKLNGALDDYDQLGYTPEFSLCSRKPGIARQFFDDNKDKIFKNDEIIVPTPDGAHKTMAPRYFMRLLADIDPDLHYEIVQKRQKRILENIKIKQSETSNSYEDMLKCTKENVTAFSNRFYKRSKI